MYSILSRSIVKIENLKRSYLITITKITMSSIQIYIPRILGTVTETEIKSVFPRMDIVPLICYMNAW